MPSVSPRITKGRFPKSGVRLERRREELDKAQAVKDWLDRRDGSAGAASKCRRIKPDSAEARAIIAQLTPRLSQQQESYQRGPKPRWSGTQQRPNENG